MQRVRSTRLVIARRLCYELTPLNLPLSWQECWWARISMIRRTKCWLTV